jgi:hypothetical protein
MDSKGAFVSIVSLTIVFVISYITFRERLRVEILPLPSCGDNESCVRFCGHFEHLSGIVIKHGENLNWNYKILKGQPCEELQECDDWTFLSNGEIIDDSNYRYDWNNYCYVAEGKLRSGERVKDVLFTCPPIYEIDTIKAIYPWCECLSLTP